MSWILLSLASAGFAAMSYICAKQALKSEHAYEFLLTGLTLHIIFSLPSLIGVTHVLSPYWWVLLFKGVIVGIAGHTSLRSFRHLEVSEAASLKNLESFIVLLLAVLFIGEIITPIKIAGIVVLIIGTFFLERVSHTPKNYLDFSFLKEKFVLYAFASIVLFSVSAVLDKILIPKLSYPIVWVYGHIFSLIAMSILFKAQGRTFKRMLPKMMAHKEWIIGGALTGTISAYFYFVAVSIPSALIAIIMPIRRLSSLFTVIIGGKFFHDHHIREKTLSCMLMIIGFILIVL